MPLLKNRKSASSLFPLFRRLGVLLLVTLLMSATGFSVAQASSGMSAGDTMERFFSPIGSAHAAGEALVEEGSSDTTEAEEAEVIVAPTPSRKDYPNVGISSRAIVWILAQMHLFFGALVLAVPLFVLVIELTGMITKDERYDDMAHEFMKISLVGFSITAIFGGSLALALFVLYPDFMGYMMHVFGAQWLVLCQSLLS